jgi:hypothetical protein
MDHTREALRRHDERTGNDSAEDAPAEEPAAAEEDEEEEPEGP